MARKNQYLCSMEIMLKKFCKKYKLPEKSLFELLSHMEEVDFSKAAMLVLPGGLPGSYNLAGHEGLAEGIMRQYKAGKPLAAICAAPLVYGRMGLLKGLKATCYPGFEENLEGASYTGNLVEEDGLFITGKGPAAVFEFGYAIVAKLAGKDKAEAVRNGMLYNEVAR